MFAPVVHDLIHRVTGLDQPHGPGWIELVSVLVLVVAPAWTGRLALRLGWRWLRGRQRRRGAGSPERRSLERDVPRATLRFQLRLVLLSLLTLPAAWLRPGPPLARRPGRGAGSLQGDRAGPARAVRLRARLVRRESAVRGDHEVAAST
ncbi:Hypothetical protein MexAM1_META1p2604 [Methylorubrum extorquens AM1]|uniref:Uncharacterized protein n=1 Tax=Methylorubrum extorquens (strain ATCC 14718 / DSM 1338 / JCM 2805 / NCIMB 9133 / AM1) TaxID=272630 RepID=C5ASD7_METEA|nr:Hypothetical protein MexAM1_META1p2604 [Methylorubrum extorquens AM1]